MPTAVPVIVFRSLSDLAGGDAGANQMNTFMALASVNSADVVRAFVAGAAGLSAVTENRHRRRAAWSPRRTTLRAQAGLAVLQDGGNAVEACVAVAASLAVVYPHMTGIGGDGFWLIAEPDGRVHAVAWLRRGGGAARPGALCRA